MLPQFYYIWQVNNSAFLDIIFNINVNDRRIEDLGKCRQTMLHFTSQLAFSKTCSVRKNISSCTWSVHAYAYAPQVMGKICLPVKMLKNIFPPPRNVSHYIQENKKRSPHSTQQQLKQSSLQLKKLRENVEKTPVSHRKTLKYHFLQCCDDN